MDINSFYKQLLRRKMLLVATVIVFGIQGLAVLKLVTPIYEAQVLILMDPDRSLDEKKGGDSYSNALRQDQYLKTQVLIARGDNVLMDVIAKLRAQSASPHANAPKPADKKASPAGAAENANDSDETRVWLREIRQALKVEVEANTDILKLSYRDVDPARAQSLANQVATTFIERHSKLYSNPLAAPFFKDQVAEARARLKEVETRFRDFSLKNNRYAQEEQRNSLIERREKVLSELAHTRSNIERTGAELSSMRVQLASLRSRMNLPDEIYGQNTLKSGVKGSDGNLGGDPPLLHVKLYQDSAQKLVNLNAELAGLRASELVQSGEATSIDKLLVDYVNQDADFSALKRAVTEAERNVELYERRGTEAQIANAWRTNESFSNLQVIEQAGLPTVPVFPRASLILPLSLLLGLVVGAGLVMLIEAIEGRRGQARNAADKAREESEPIFRQAPKPVHSLTIKDFHLISQRKS